MGVGLGVMAAGMIVGSSRACFDGQFLAGRPCDHDADCGPSLSCNVDGFCGDMMDELCGNGLIEVNEECDDGNGADDDNCTNACKVAFCGDGIVGPGEDCDDANGDNTDECSDTCKLAGCGDGQVGLDEICDDGNMDDTDACTTLCAPPSCDDGILSGNELAVDCGAEACEDPCGIGDPCTSSLDCAAGICAPIRDSNLGVCRYPVSCAEFLMFAPEPVDGPLDIDPDGKDGPQEPFTVECNMTRSDGGWTLVMIVSDDGDHTWTWGTRERLVNGPYTTGSLDDGDGADETRHDYMSEAYNQVEATDIMFVHQPSDVWAVYAGVGAGTPLPDFFAKFAEEPSSLCDYSADSGVEMADGNLEAISSREGDSALCDTDLYFQCDLDDVDPFMLPTTSPTFGPVWNGGPDTDSCDFSQPAQYSLGLRGPCELCGSAVAVTEHPSLGYAEALGLNDAASEIAENYMAIYVR